MTHTVHLDRSLRLAVSGEAGCNLAAIRLSRGSAEVLADALLEFAGNQLRGLSRRSAVKVEAEALAAPDKACKEGAAHE